MSLPLNSSELVDLLSAGFSSPVGGESEQAGKYIKAVMAAVR